MAGIAATVLALFGGGANNDQKITRAGISEQYSAGVFELPPALRGPSSQEEDSVFLEETNPEYYEPVLPRQPRYVGRPQAFASTPIGIGSVQERFTQGWLDGGGDGSLLSLVYCIVNKESSWDAKAVGPGGPYYGLGQFLMSTWNNVGGGDWADAYTQGRNMAKNWSNPAGQWPRAYAICTGAV